MNGINRSPFSKQNGAATLSQFDFAKRADWFAVCGLVLATLVAYIPALGGGFLLDDDLLLTANPLIKSASGWWQFWCTHKTPDYLPLMSDSFWIEWRLWGMNPAGYHATNILLHAASAVLFWLLLRRVGVPGALFGALIFALHPVNVRSVAWIAERKNTLSMVFYLGALLVYFRAQDEQSRKLYAGALALFVCALLSKSSTVMLPVVLLIVTWYRTRRLTIADLVSSAPFFAASLLAALATVWYQYHVEIKPWNISAEPFLWRLASAGNSVWFYVSKDLLPINLAMIYPRIQINESSAVDYIPTLLVAAALGVFYWNRRTWGALPLVVFGYFVVTLLPVLGFLNMAFFKSSMVSDHLQYIPMLGIAAACGALLESLVQRSRLAGLSAVAIVLCVFATLTTGQAALYRDRLTLARDTLRTNPNSFWAHGENAMALAHTGDLAGAERELRVVLALDPRSIGGYNNLANILMREERYAEATNLLVKAEQLDPENVMVHLNLGMLYLKLGYNEPGKQEFERAEQLDPGNRAAAQALAQLGAGR